MNTLRSKVIRLAHSNPKLRPDLLPLLAGDTRLAASPSGYIVEVNDEDGTWWVGDGVKPVESKSKAWVMSEPAAKKIVKDLKADGAAKAKMVKAAANTNEAVRPHLLPLLRAAAGTSGERYVVGPGPKDDDGAPSFLVWDHRPDSATPKTWAASSQHAAEDTAFKMNLRWYKLVDQQGRKGLVWTQVRSLPSTHLAWMPTGIYDWKPMANEGP